MSAKHPIESRDDLDRTDELPQLDPEAYEAQLRIAEDLVSETDSWKMPDVTSFQDSRISQLEAELRDREAAMDALRGHLEQTSSSKSRLSAELDGILQKIADLEAQLSERDESNTSLTTRCERLEVQRRELQGRLAAAEQSLAQLGEARRAADQQVAELQGTLADHRRHSETGIAALQQQLAEARSTAEARITDLESALTEAVDGGRRTQQEREALRGELDLQRAAYRDAVDRGNALQHQLDTQTEAAAHIARLLAQQCAQSDALQRALQAREAEVARLAVELGARDRRVLALEQEIESETEQKLDLGTQLSARQSAVEEVERALAIRDQRVQALESQIQSLHDNLQAATTERTRLVESLQAEQEAVRQVREQLSAGQQEARAVRDQLQHSVEQVHQLLQAAEAHRNELAVRDAAAAELAAKAADAVNLNALLEGRILGLGQTIERLEQMRGADEESTRRLSVERDEYHERWQTAAQRCAELEAESRTRSEQIRSLEHELETAQRSAVSVTGELERTRLEVKNLADNLTVRDRNVAALESQLSAHIKALAAIRHDVERIGGGHHPDSTETLVRSLVSVDDDKLVHMLSARTMIIGRNAECDVHIDSNSVSRHHARLLVGPGAVILEDLDSTNGCYVNGRRVKKQLLRDGDFLMIGKARFRFSSRTAEHSAA